MQKNMTHVTYMHVHMIVCIIPVQCNMCMPWAVPGTRYMQVCVCMCACMYIYVMYRPMSAHALTEKFHSTYLIV